MFFYRKVMFFYWIKVLSSVVLTFGDGLPCVAGNKTTVRCMGGLRNVCRATLDLVWTFGRVGTWVRDWKWGLDDWTGLTMVRGHSRLVIPTPPSYSPNRPGRFPGLGFFIAALIVEICRVELWPSNDAVELNYDRPTMQWGPELWPVTDVNYDRPTMLSTASLPIRCSWTSAVVRMFYL